LQLNGCKEIWQINLLSEKYTPEITDALVASVAAAVAIYVEVAAAVVHVAVSAAATESAHRTHIFETFGLCSMSNSWFSNS
jgi:hypothetical protein